MKAAIYARVSTDRQESMNQIAELREYAARKGWEIVREYVDEDVRGKDRKPQLEALLAAAQIAQERAAGASWGSLASKYGLPRTSVRRLYQKGLAENDGGHGREGGPS